MSIAARLSLFYSLVFAFYAVHLAYWPLWLKDRGLTDATVGWLLAFGFIAKLAVHPMFRHLASRAADTRRALAATLALAGGVFVLFGVSHTVTDLVMVQMLFFLFWVPVLPTTEYLALSQARHHGFDYGRVRLWGSVAFLASSLLVGRWLENRGISRAFAVQAVFLACIVAASAVLPPETGSNRLARGFSVARLWRVPGLAALILVAGLIQGSHAMFFGFSSIHWKSIGIGETVIGLLWAEGILAEIGIFLMASRLKGAATPPVMLAMGGAAACIRWLFLPLAPGAPALAVLQLLHGVSFALTHLGAIGFISARVPETLSANALALYSMTVMGIFLGAAVLASGALYAIHGGYAFWFMALLAGAGAVLAMLVFRRQTVADDDRRNIS